MTSPSPEHLLIVDDEIRHLRALCDTLEAHGYVTTGFTSPKDALAALKKQKSFDLVLTDLMMPEMDGIALLRAAQEVDPSVVGVIMTGHATVNSAVSAMKEGALDYVMKPFKMSTIIPVLARALAVRRLRLENEGLQHRLHNRTLELEAANKELETFSYSVSHDLRAPLRAITGYLELMLEQLGDRVDDESRTYADNVHASVKRMNTLIDDLLRLARTTRAEMHRQPVNLSRIAQEISEKSQSLDPRDSEWIIEPDVTAEGDLGLLRVVLENLLSNAWKYTAKTERTRIEFGVEMQPEGHPAYYVRDNGAGFDMKYANRLFGPFQRLHAERDFPGTGVGLATVQRIIHKHGGRIWAKAAPNEGATFYFTLPPGPTHER